ncbi:hypothetical protein J3Q64DRAFT_1726382 [Phycomyces blakesleeanus]|uniref:DUF3752 domain-containing protein n=2 Tax=Phycomyces blakesleeanus TaxID=4837 RepID=A0A162Q896_PHYB8|nr:hypothetical protein PHYBLDRAFT_61981 [Phycomyces blakesleeanus NRRL 1555(-)]OAD80936.1 hypothetical protein PHYBLDRAFT_61981 [Phycomyces blakesleeanus NRRL 1555(-)]|eukprot:XP_018298976.1 hypothetical protein PHYBLDRAFT_61981 [Phycomyces blakesleeanus NRRL 1555(-)]
MIGPEIPSHLLQPKQSPEPSPADESSTVSIGPVLPPHLANRSSSVPETQLPSVPTVPAVDTAPASDDEDAFLPELPPDLLEQRKKTEPKPQIEDRNNNNNNKQQHRRRRPVGPAMPSCPLSVATYEDAEDIGPVLPSSYDPEKMAVQSTMADIEERARQSKEQMEKKDDPSGKIERPEWMLLPPEVDYLKAADSGRSRTFNNRQLSDRDRDNSGWTESPSDKKNKKRKEAKDDVPRASLEQERIIKHNIEKHNRSERPLSLMEMHQKKRKVNREMEDVRNRPFDREKDLKGYKPMDKKQKKEFMRQSGILDDRFGSSSRGSFL